jgi:hypothetical protein
MDFLMGFSLLVCCGFFFIVFDFFSLYASTIQVISNAVVFFYLLRMFLKTEDIEIFFFVLSYLIVVVYSRIVCIFVICKSVASFLSHAILWIGRKKMLVDTFCFLLHVLICPNDGICPYSKEIQHMLKWKTKAFYCNFDALWFDRIFVLILSISVFPVPLWGKIRAEKLKKKFQLLWFDRNFVYDFF